MTTSIQLGAIDLHRPAIDVLIDKINAINTLSLVSSDFTLGPPVAEAGEDYDTKISLIPSAASIWLNAKWAYYSRVSMESVMRIPTRVVTGGNALLYDILDAVNSAYGVYLQEADVEQASITYVNGADTSGPGTVEITARSTSVFYKGTITIPVNTQSRQGLNTYDDEAIYYVLAQIGGKDTVVAYNTRGENVETFTGFRGATMDVSNVHHFEMLPNGDMLLIGEFEYQMVNGFGETIEYVRKLIKLNPQGNIIDSAAGNVYGANYPNIKRKFEKVTGAVHVIDPLNEIGGRPSLIHRFNPDGTYDNNFSLGLGAPATHFAVHDGFIYVARNVAGVINVTKHNSTTGVVDDTFAPISLSGVAPLAMYSMAADAQGLKLVVDAVEATRSAFEPVMNNGVELWAPGPSTASWFPCLNFTLEGLPASGNIYWRAGLGSEFVGQMVLSDPVDALSSGWLVAPSVSFHPYYGRQSFCLISFSPGGEVVRSVGVDPKQNPIWLNVKSIEHVENGDIAVCGEVECLNNELEVTNGTALALYNRLGELSTTLVTVFGGEVFKKAFGRVP